MKKNSKFLGGLISGLLLALLFLGSGYIVKEIYSIYLYKQASSGTVGIGKAVSNDVDKKLEIIADTISEYYLDDVEKNTIVDGIYSGMVDSLEDPYSEYYSVEELKEIEKKTAGIYYGIGAYVRADTESNLCEITGVIENTPAEEAQLRSGDLILEVDGTSVLGMDATDVTLLIKGEEGTTVNMVIIRDGLKDNLEVVVERRKIESPTVKYEMLDEDIGYIQITEFDDVTEDQFAEAMAVCEGSGMKGMILDLRGNPGGNLSTVCEVSRKLLPEGMIVYTEDKYGNRDEYTCDGSNEIEIPLVVLIDGYSASASEILAGAIKDYGIGTLMGTTTFGKGIVQRIITLTDGSALKLTVSKYYTPSGNNIHDIGIEPDIEVVFDGELYYDKFIDNQLDAAIIEIKDQMK